MKKILLFLLAFVAFCMPAKAQDCIYLVGNMPDCYWVAPTVDNAAQYENWKLPKVADGVYEATFTINQTLEFRFYKELSGWDGGASLGRNNESVTEIIEKETTLLFTQKWQNTWKVTWNGEITFRVNLNENNVLVTKGNGTDVEHTYSYAIHGTIVNGGSDWQPFTMTEKDGLWTISGEFVAGDFGIRKVDEQGNQTDWLFSVSGSNNISGVGTYKMVAQSQSNGDNFHLAANGKYTLTFDPVGMTLTVSDYNIQIESKDVYCVAPEGSVADQVRIYVYDDNGRYEYDWNNRATMERVENATYNGQSVYKHTITGNYDRVIFTFNENASLRYPEGDAAGLLIENDGTYILLACNNEGWVSGYETPVVAPCDIYTEMNDIQVDKGEIVSVLGIGAENVKDVEVGYTVKNALGVEFTGTTKVGVVAVDEVTLHIARPLGKAFTVDLTGDYGQHSINVPALKHEELEESMSYIMINGNTDVAPIMSVTLPAKVIFSQLTVTPLTDAAQTMSLRAAPLTINGKSVLLDLSVDNEPAITEELAAIKTGGVTGVADVTVDAAEAEYYNLQGIRVANPEAGNVYIRRIGNTAVKVAF